MAKNEKMLTIQQFESEFEQIDISAKSELTLHEDPEEDIVVFDTVQEKFRNNYQYYAPQPDPVEITSPTSEHVFSNHVYEELELEDGEPRKNQSSLWRGLLVALCMAPRQV